MSALAKPALGLSRDQTAVTNEWQGSSMTIYERPYSSPGERFWSKVKADGSGCWLWQAAIFGCGYGSFWFKGRNIRAHQFSYDESGQSVPLAMS